MKKGHLRQTVASSLIVEAAGIASMRQQATEKHDVIPGTATAYDMQFRLSEAGRFG